MYVIRQLSSEMKEQNKIDINEKVSLPGLKMGFYSKGFYLKPQYYKQIKLVIAETESRRIGLTSYYCHLDRHKLEVSTNLIAFISMF